VLGAIIGASVGQRTVIDFCERGTNAVRVPANTTVFNAPDGRGGVLQVLELDTSLCVDRAPSGGFHRVKLADGRQGYVLDAALEKGPPDEVPPEPL
jgi:hypothetical protein